MNKPIIAAQITTQQAARLIARLAVARLHYGTREEARALWAIAAQAFSGSQTK